MDNRHEIFLLEGVYSTHGIAGGFVPYVPYSKRIIYSQSIQPIP